MAPKIQIHLDPDFKEIIDPFLDSSKGNCREILSSNDLSLAITYGHQMKGAGSGYGVDKVTELGAQIEQNAKAGKLEEVKRQAQELLDYLENIEILFN